MQEYQDQPGLSALLNYDGGNKTKSPPQENLIRIGQSLSSMIVDTRERERLDVSVTAPPAAASPFPPLVFENIVTPLQALSGHNAKLISANRISLSNTARTSNPADGIDLFVYLNNHEMTCM